MTEQQIIYTALGSTLTAIVGMIGLWLKQRGQRQTYTDKTAADVTTVNTKARAETEAALVEIAKQGLTVTTGLQSVVVENTRASERFASKIEGMLLAIENQNKGIEEVRTHYPLLQTSIATIRSAQTELGDSMNSQFGPVVDALKEVGGQVRKLAEEISAADTITHQRLAELTSAFQLAETRFVDRLDKFVAHRSTVTETIATVEQIATLASTNGEITHETI